MATQGPGSSHQGALAITTVHPDGCPQGVESCFVDPHVTSYEEACKTCCESRHHAPTGEYACWDDAFSL
jgi:hypothetical protein